MPRVNTVKKARKSPGTCGKCGCKIEEGQPYKHWSFRITSGKSYISSKRIRCMKSDCAPKPSDLTQSEFWGSVNDIKDEGFPGDSFSDLQSARDDIAGRLNELADEQQGKFDNMPEGLKQGSTGQLLEERVSALQDAAQELESVDIPDDPEEIIFDETDPQKVVVKLGSDVKGKIMHTKSSRRDYWEFTPEGEKADEDSRGATLDEVKEWVTEHLSEDNPDIEETRQELCDVLENISCS